MNANQNNRIPYPTHLTPAPTACYLHTLGLPNAHQVSHVPDLLNPDAAVNGYAQSPSGARHDPCYTIVSALPFRVREVKPPRSFICRDFLKLSFGPSSSSPSVCRATNMRYPVAFVRVA